jgi:bifunctional non-homologous end joining protein LigD
MHDEPEEASQGTSGAVREVREVAGHVLSLSNLDKVLYPATGFRKRDLLAYYEGVAPLLLPHLANRALHLGRWPSGVTERGWLQANCRAPSWVRRHVVTGKRGQTLEFCVIDDLATLLWAAQQGTLELHPFQWHVAHPDEPRALVFDLDPGPRCDLAHCARAALELRAALAPLECFVKTSGHKGMHVLVPLNGGATFAEAKTFARRIAADLAARHDWLTDKMAKIERTNRVFIDVSQNDPGKQTIAPYSLRATQVPLVSAPLAWDELDAPTYIQPRAMLERVAKYGDLFARVLTLQQRLG